MSKISQFTTSIPKVRPRATSSIAKSLARKPPQTYLGEERQNDQRLILKHSERLAHTHIIGSTGTGKSKLMELMLRKDVINRRAGVCLLDPHGSLYEDLVTFISHRYPNHADRCVLFNPASDLENVMGFNPIPSPVEHLDYLLDSLISACLKAWGQDNADETPRIAKWLENVFYTIIANDLTLVEAAPLLNVHNATNRNIMLGNVHSDPVLDDWMSFNKSNVNQKLNTIEGVANRLRKFLRNGIIRNIIGQKNSSINFTDLMEEGKIVLINLNGQGRISNDNSKLLGVLLVNEIFRCAKLRNPRDPSKKPFFFYIDEFANFVTRDVARSLEEARKFGLFLTLSHQHLSQLKTDDEYLYASVMTNCKNKVVFGGLSHEDAELMMKEVSTGFMDLKWIKDQQTTYRERHRLELRETHSYNTSKTKGKSLSETIGKSFGKSTSKGKTVTDGSSTGQSSTTGSSSGSSSSTNSGFNDSRSESKDHKSTSSGFSSGKSQSNNYSTNQSQSHSQSRQHSESHSETEGTSETDTHSTGTGTSSSKSRSKGVSESWVNVPEPFEEISSTTFWSLNELQHMETAMIKNQGIAEAFIKIDNAPPRKLNVTNIKDVPYSPRHSPLRVEQYTQRVFSAHPQYYTSAIDIKTEYDLRQTQLFGKPLQFDENQMTSVNNAESNSVDNAYVGEPAVDDATHRRQKKKNKNANPVQSSTGTESPFSD